MDGIVSLYHCVFSRSLFTFAGLLLEWWWVVICCWTADGSGLWMMMMDVVGVLMRLMGGHL
jgi:hypothetical protein